MKNEIIYDKMGRPDIMVTFTPEELGLPAELKGRAVAEYCISKYQNTLIDGVPYSLPYQKPAVNIDHDEAVRLCESKGEGWHLMTNDEWAAIALKAWTEDTIPTGNTAAGKSHSHPEQTGIEFNDSGKTLTGSGPVQWNHDRTAAGIADMVGNIWEHVGGLRFMNGQAQIIPDHGAAAGADQSASSKEWTPILAMDGSPIYYNPIDGDIILQPHKANEQNFDGVRFTDLLNECDLPDQLIELGLYPPESMDAGDYFWIDNSGERIAYRGGSWYSGGDAGLFYLYAHHGRSFSYTLIGFRSAFVRYSENLESENLDKESEDKPAEPDSINHPSHYTSGSMESIDLMIAKYGAEAVINFCLCNVDKYTYRYKNKGGTEDLKKARWYLNKAIELEQ